jgi:hypothetical protein
MISTVFLSDPRYGIYSESTDLNSRTFMYDDAKGSLFLKYKIADKEAVIIAYQRQTVRGVSAWVPKGCKVVPWDTNTAFEEFLVNLATGLAYMAAFVALAPAIGYGIALASVGLFADAAVALIPVAEREGSKYLTSKVLPEFFD